PNSVSQFQNPIGNVFKCRKLSSSRPFPSLSSEPVSNQSSTLCIDDVSAQNPDAPLPQRFRLRFEISSPNSFSIAPEVVDGFYYPGAETCFAKLEQWLSNVMMTHTTQNHSGGVASVYKLRDYEVSLKCLKNCKDRLKKYPGQHILCWSQRWIPCRPEHLPDEKVEDLISKLPKILLNTLMPFQFDGLRFGLRRGGRCLIADEMGLGKTLQAIAIASCFADEGPILVVCPAILRYAWAEELEHWLPTCLPSDSHLVFGHQNDPAKLTRLPRVVVTSYTMLGRLQKSMLEINWAVLIVDESHHVMFKEESRSWRATLDMATKVRRVILLSGTPSLSRSPGLLGKTKYDFAQTYCSMKLVQDSQGKSYRDFSQGCRLQELSVLLRQTVMIRRLKENLLVQLPPKRRQIIRLALKKSDIILAKEAIAKHDTGIGDGKQDKPSDISDTADVTSEVDGAGNADMDSSGHKMIIFAHHHIVFDKIQEFFCYKGIGFVLIDGKTLDIDRQSTVKSFQSSTDVKVAMIGIKVWYAGINLSAAQSVVFVELPKEPTSLLQVDSVSCLGNSNDMNESTYRTPYSETGAAVNEEKCPQGFIPEDEVNNDSDTTDEEMVHGTQKKPYRKAGEQSEVGISIKTDNLRFEVSLYTGRIHLWACIPGVDSRPRPLSESFQPEEIISGCSKYASGFIKKNPACRDALLVFIDGWNNLRRVDKRKLSSNPRKPEFFEDLFCNLTCSEEYRSRTSNKFLRHELFKIEHGICTSCQLDCHKLVLHLRPLTLEMRAKYIKRAAPNLAERQELVDKLVAEPTEGNAWHADHYVPVYQGGGECRIENLRTLCVACHADVTAAQCAERKLAKRHLNEAIRSSRVQISSSPEPATNLDDDDDEFRLVRVPVHTLKIQSAQTIDMSWRL
ncbi:hypothetical protein V2J09_014937, partial [Rumex salicifolius]